MAKFGEPTLGFRNISNLFYKDGLGVNVKLQERGELTMDDIPSAISKHKTGIATMKHTKSLLKNSGSSILNFIHVIFKGDRVDLLEDLGSWSEDSYESITSKTDKLSSGLENTYVGNKAGVSDTEPHPAERIDRFDNANQSLSDIFRKKLVRDISVTNLNQAYESIDTRKLAEEANQLVQQVKILQSGASPVNPDIS